MSRNSVLEEFRVRRFAVIQEEIRSRASWRWRRQSRPFCSFLCAKSLQLSTSAYYDNLLIRMLYKDLHWKDLHCTVTTVYHCSIFSLFNSYFVWFAFGNFLLKEYMMIMLIKFYFLSQWTTFCSRVDPHLPIFNKKMISPFGSPMDSAMRWNTDNGTTISFEQ